MQYFSFLHDRFSLGPFKAIMVIP